MEEVLGGEIFKIGSHNSWSFNPIKQWWLKPFFFFSKCQRGSIL